MSIIRGPEGGPNIIARKGLHILAVSALALGAVSCGGEGQDDEKPLPVVVDSHEIGSDGGEPVITTEFFGNGTSMVIIRNPNGYYQDSQTIRYCEGGDMVETHAHIKSGDNGIGVGGSASRSVEHPACDDGVLTEADFE